jgi:hypothetical protein
LDPVQTWIGARRVLANESLLLGPLDASFGAIIGGNSFIMTFTHSESPLQANYDSPSTNTLRISVVGKLFTQGAYWDFPNIAVWDGQPISLTLAIRAVLEPRIYREVSYTITTTVPGA